MIEEALAENRPDAAETFRLALNGERHHLQIFREALQKLERKLGKKATAPRAERAAVGAPASDGGGGTAVDLAAPPVAGSETGEVYTEKGRIEALSRIREVIFGMQDGLVTTATLGAAVAGATTGSHTVIIAGLAAALGGTFSMAGGAFLGSRAERQVQEAELANEAREIELHPAEELAELIEIYRLEGFSYEEAVSMAENVASDRQRWLATLAEKELGLPSEIITSPIKDAAAMAGAFAIGGMLPLIPYFFASGGEIIIASVAIAIVALFGMGVAKARVVRRNPIISGLETAVIGTVVAAIGYVLGNAFPAS
jgi:VIT1/CCC1 family predicted Fe2+/Mn2+ transporter